MSTGVAADGTAAGHLARCDAVSFRHGQEPLRLAEHSVSKALVFFYTQAHLWRVLCDVMVLCAWVEDAVMALLAARQPCVHQQLVKVTRLLRQVARMWRWYRPGPAALITSTSSCWGAEAAVDSCEAGLDCWAGCGARGRRLAAAADVGWLAAARKQAATCRLTAADGLLTTEPHRRHCFLGCGLLLWKSSSLSLSIWRSAQRRGTVCTHRRLVIVPNSTSRVRKHWSLPESVPTAIKVVAVL